MSLSKTIYLKRRYRWALPGDVSRHGWHKATLPLTSTLFGSDILADFRKLPYFHIAPIGPDNRFMAYPLQTAA